MSVQHHPCPGGRGSCGSTVPIATWKCIPHPIVGSPIRSIAARYPSRSSARPSCGPGCHGHTVALRTTSPVHRNMPCHVQNAQCLDSAELPPRPIMALSEQSIMLQPQGATGARPLPLWQGGFSGCRMVGGGWHASVGILAVRGREHSTGPSVDCPLAEVMATKEHLFWPFNQRSPIRNAEHLTSEPPNSSSLLASDESVSLPVSGIRSLQAPSR